MKIILKKSLRFTVIATLCLVFVGLFVTYSCDKYEKSDEDKHEKSEIEHVKTELDVLYCSKDVLSCGEDTVTITVSADTINVFVGFTMRRKDNPFETQVETIDDVLYIHIIDKCDYPIEGECYSRGIPYPYYTFDFIFKYQGEINQKYKVLLRTILIPLGDSPIYDSTEILSEGIITNTNP